MAHNRCNQATIQIHRKTNKIRYLILSQTLIGLVLFVIGAGIYELTIRPTNDDAINFTAFKAERLASCIDDGLESSICSCLIEKAALHKPLNDAKVLSSFKSADSITMSKLINLPAVTLEDAYIRGTLAGSMNNLSKYEINGKSIKPLINQIKLRAAAKAMEGCAPASIFADRASYLKRGKKYYDVPHNMKRTFRVAQLRRTMIASGEISE